MSHLIQKLFVALIVVIGVSNPSSAVVVFNAGFEYGVEPTSAAIGNDAANLNGMFGQVGTFSGAIPNGIDVNNANQSGNFAPDLMGFENGPNGGRLLWVDRPTADGSFSLNMANDGVKLDGNATFSFDVGTRRTQNGSDEKDYDIIGFDGNGNESFHLRVSANNNNALNNRRLNAIVDGGTLVTDFGVGDANGDVPNTGGPAFGLADIANIELTLRTNGYIIDFFRDAGTDIDYTTGLINYNGNANTLTRIDVAFNGNLTNQVLASGFILDNLLVNGDSVIPEPTTGLLALLGMGAMGLRRRRVA